MVNSEVAQIPGLLLTWIKGQVPQVVTLLIQLLSNKLLGSISSRFDTSTSTGIGALSGGGAGFAGIFSSEMLGRPLVNIAGFGSPFQSAPVPLAATADSSHIGASNALTATTTAASVQHATVVHGALANLKAIAILPANAEVDAEAFSLELQHALSPIGSTVRLTSGRSHSSSIHFYSPTSMHTHTHTSAGQKTGSS
ncbi:unnamed protein product [Protopolystoma xenopodis]|uniref:Uncharacterized protein n=1 Tax=Protopolystoma xenopodis TaxID=117903 RepID=A0A3S4ZY80_9PLAT|nr:unnamed protein product [Protopolystoma xenopodis]